MTAIISKCVSKTLCDHQGSLEFRQLEEKIARSFTVAESVLRTVLFDDEKIAIQEGKEKLSGGQIVSADSLIVAKSSLRVCQEKTAESCSRCDELHLCRYYICGECMFGYKCKNPHTLATPHNTALLKRHGLQDLTEKQLFQLLLQNDPYLVPEVCPHYNRGNGQHGSCRFTTTCTKLHVCQHFLQGVCKFGADCKRAHRFDAQAMKLLRGFSRENIENLYKIYKNKLIIAGQHFRPPAAAVVPVMPEVKSPPCPPSHQQSNPRNCKVSPAKAAAPSKPMSDAERNEICLFFIRRHCSFKEKCARVHWHLPYRWQVLDIDGVTWKDLVNMENIEKAYCDPANDTSSADQPAAASGILQYLLRGSATSSEPSVDFLTMTYEGLPVRRLSTASSVSKPPHFILTTEWAWYWKDEDSQWQEYGKGQGGATAAVTSKTLENVYLADRDSEIPFGAGNHQYVLSFKDPAGSQQMYQQNLKFKTKREVRRRPYFVSTQEVEALLKSTPSQSSSTSLATVVPPTWDKNALQEFGYRLVNLTKTAKEYSMIELLFKRTMPQSQINSIQRIQNMSLWKVFQWQKEQMKERNGGQLINEKYLFHGTDESLIEAICEQNFDWRVCGVHGTAYGKGSYFARDASYSDRYAKASQSNKTMFVALVLVGEFTRGSSSYVRPPPKGSGRALFDSCVDSERDPSIYVIFEKQQIYPEFLIKYT